MVLTAKRTEAKYTLCRICLYIPFQRLAGLFGVPWCAQSIPAGLFKHIFKREKFVFFHGINLQNLQKQLGWIRKTGVFLGRFFGSLPNLYSCKQTTTQTLPNLYSCKQTTTQTLPNLYSCKQTTTQTLPNLYSCKQTTTQTPPNQLILY